MENEGRFPFGSLILKVILVIMFVFLLIWLFPMPNVKPIYDRLFTENLTEMKDAAKSYYTVDRLPKEVNKTVRMTLTEMLSMKLLLPIADSKDKLCDGTSSYVEITKTDTEYILKANLVCPNKSDYVIEHMGCYDLCPRDCVETKPIIKPTYVKPVVVTDTMYELKRVWLKGSRTVTTDATTQYKHVKYTTDRVFKGYTYSCPLGSSNLNGTTCYKYEGVNTYSCSSGTLVSATDHRCKIAGTAYTYSCPAGSSNLNGTTCSKTENVTTYSCSSGTLVSDTDHRCKIAGTAYTYSCPATYTSSGSGSSMTCSKSVANGTSQVYYGSGEGKSIPTSTSTKKYVSTGTRTVKDCNACASYILYTYNIYNIVTNYKTVYADRIATAYTTYSYANANATTSTKTTSVAAIATAYTTYSYVNANVATSTKTTAVSAIATAQYEYSTYISDTKWTNKFFELGYIMIEVKTIPGTSTTIYTDWVTTLPSGYSQIDSKVEYKWSAYNAENGWTYTGNSKTTTK